MALSCIQTKKLKGVKVLIEEWSAGKADPLEVLDAIANLLGVR
jgi:hypothetical protein